MSCCWEEGGGGIEASAVGVSGGGGTKGGRRRCGVDSGIVVVLFITAVYVVLVFGLFFYVKNDWCYVLFSNFTVSNKGRPHKLLKYMSCP